MPYVPPIVGYFGRLADTGHYRMYGTCCATPDDFRPDDFAALLADNFMDSGGDGKCESCGHLLTDDPRELVHVDYGADVASHPVRRRSAA